MRARIALALLLVALLMPLHIGTVRADAPRPVHFVGQATASDVQPLRLLINARSADPSAWQLELTLARLVGRRVFGVSGDDLDRSRERTPVRLTGRFTLTGPDEPIRGQVTGSLDAQGRGSLQLIEEMRSRVLTASIAIDQTGSVALDVSGLAPADATASTSTRAGEGASTGVGDHTFWYVARASGLSAYLVLFVNLCLGLFITTKLSDRFIARWRIVDLHQFTSLLVLGLLTLHIGALLGDRYIGFTVSQVLIPFASPYRPFWTALGVFGLYLSIVITASFFVRRFIGYRMWRVLHYTTFGLYLLVLLHGLWAGTDTSRPWAQVLYWTTGLAVAALTIWRSWRPPASPSALIAVRSDRLAQPSHRFASEREP